MTTTRDLGDLRDLRDLAPGVRLGDFLRCPRSGWEFALLAPPPPLLVDAATFAPSSRFFEPFLPLEVFVRALLRLLRRSQALTTAARPQRKEDLWAAAFPRFGRARELQLGLERWMLALPEFPRAVLSLHQYEVDPEALNALLRAFCEGDGGDEVVEVGLKFSQLANFGIPMLETLIAFLDELYARPDRRVAIRSLDLSHNQMGVEQLALLGELLERNKRIYRIAEIALNDIFFSRHRESDEADKIVEVLNVVFTEPLDQSASRSQALPAPLTMRRLSFDHSSLRLQHFAAMCSSFRYGCLVEDLSLLSTLNRVSAEDRKQCWRWLAFGLFYPRSKRLQTPFVLTKIDLSRIELRVADAKAVKSTLSDPAAELVCDGRPWHGVVTGTPHLHYFKAGSVVYESANDVALCLGTLHHDRELEVLARNVNGWVCVVYPGFGIGWIECEEAMSPSEGDYDTSVDRLYELTVHRLSSKKAPITSLIESIGRHLSLLSVKFNTVDIGAIAAHCVNLKHLDIEGCSVQGSSVDALLLAGANSRFFRGLESLNLNDTDISSSCIDKLVGVLSSQEQPTKLRELRLVSSDVSGQSLAHICDMLAVNKTLVVLELQQLHARLHSASLCLDFEERFQDELLKIVSSPRSKLAFLSVLNRDSAERDSSLDADSVAAIFAFAGAPVRRRIMWRLHSDDSDEED